MELIKHNDKKYGFFVGYKPDPKGTGPQPVFQPDKDKARITFKYYLEARPATNVKREYSTLLKNKRFVGKLSIIWTW